jgi:SHS2 domain-containing protein
VTGAYRQIDHTGDLGVEVEAAREDDLYAACASAMFDILAEAGGVAEAEARRLRVTAPDREVLLVRWLRELLYLHAAEGWIFRSFEVELGGEEGARWLSGEARGERFDASRHRIRTELKAVTYHQASVRRGPEGGWTARVIFDV